MMDIHQILKKLPHRYPLLLVDRVLEFEANQRIKALKNVTINEPFFVGHFPHRPVMTGVLMLEALAQTAALLSFESMGAALDLHLQAGLKPIPDQRLHVGGVLPVDRSRRSRGGRAGGPSGSVGGVERAVERHHLVLEVGRVDDDLVVALVGHQCALVIVVDEAVRPLAQDAPANGTGRRLDKEAQGVPDVERLHNGDHE